MKRIKRSKSTLLVLWMLIAAWGSTGAPARGENPVDGFGPWRFGMTLEEVRAVEAGGPYSEVAATGGLETENGDFDGRKTNVSFVFGPEGLNHIQIWAYTGGDFDQASAAWHGVYRHLVDRFGRVRSPEGVWPLQGSAEELKDRLRERFEDDEKEVSLEELKERGSIQAEVSKLFLAPVVPVAGAEIYSTFIKSPQLGIYWVFLFYRALPPNAVP